jgi:hypothetical protein
MHVHEKEREGGGGEGGNSEIPAMQPDRHARSGACVHVLMAPFPAPLANRQISKALLDDEQRLKIPKFLEEEKDPMQTKQVRARETREAGKGRGGEE